VWLIGLPIHPPRSPFPIDDQHSQEFKSLRDQRTNDVLYTLTIVTTLFVPLQFLTGVYGYAVIRFRFRLMDGCIGL
jgi:hypothetical protein